MANHHERWEGKGKQFDPKCVEVLLDELPEIKEVLKNLTPVISPKKMHKIL